VRGNTIAGVVLSPHINADAHRDPIVVEMLRNQHKQIGEALTQCFAITIKSVAIPRTKVLSRSVCCYFGCWLKAWQCARFAILICRQIP